MRRRRVDYKKLAKWVRTHARGKKARALAARYTKFANRKFWLMRYRKGGRKVYRVLLGGRKPSKKKFQKFYGDAVQIVSIKRWKGRRK